MLPFESDTITATAPPEPVDADLTADRERLARENRPPRVRPVPVKVAGKKAPAKKAAAAKKAAKRNSAAPLDPPAGTTDLTPPPPVVPD